MKISDIILTNSSFSKKSIEKYTNKPIKEIPLAYKSKDEKQKIKKSNQVFIIGNKQAHKNKEKAVDLLNEYNRLNGKKFTPYMSEGKKTKKEITKAYQESRFSMFLSDIEGFGLPLIESYYHYTPVVFNNKTALSEVGQNLPGGCNINDKKSIFRAIDSILNLDKKEIKDLRKSLIRKYNWEKTKGKLIKFFKTLKH